MKTAFAIITNVAVIAACCYLAVNDHPWLAALVLILGLHTATKKEE